MIDWTMEDVTGVQDTDLFNNMHDDNTESN